MKITIKRNILFLIICVLFISFLLAGSFFTDTVHRQKNVYATTFDNEFLICKNGNDFALYELSDTNTVIDTDSDIFDLIQSLEANFSDDTTHNALHFRRGINNFEALSIDNSSISLRRGTYTIYGKVTRDCIDQGSATLIAYGANVIIDGADTLIEGTDRSSACFNSGSGTVTIKGGRVQSQHEAALGLNNYVENPNNFAKFIISGGYVANTSSSTPAISLNVENSPVSFTALHIKGGRIENINNLDSTISKIDDNNVILRDVIFDNYNNLFYTGEAKNITATLAGVITDDGALSVPLLIYSQNQTIVFPINAGEYLAELSTHTVGKYQLIGSKTFSILKAVPDIPEVEILDKTKNSLTIKPFDDAQYSIDDGHTWQDSNVFENLKPSTKYKIAIRIKGNDNIETVSSNIIEVSTPGSLSVGAIVGISVGGTAAAGAVGFAAYWLFIKEKAISLLTKAGKSVPKKLAKKLAKKARKEYKAQKEKS